MEDFINELLGDDLEIVKKVDFNDLIFVFFKPKGYSNPYKDERLNLVSSSGPLKINIKTREYEFTHIYEFYSEYGDNEIIFPKKDEVALDWGEVLYNIKMRERFNSEDFFLLLKNYNLPLDSFDIYSINSRDTIEIEIKHDEAVNYLIEFLEKINGNYIKKNTNHFLIQLNI